MSPDESALIAGIVATPDDDLPRLVYADWLDENGQSERARFIRVQCEIEKLRAEEAGLLQQHKNTWSRELRERGADWCKFHRGFPEEIGATLDTFLIQYSNLNALTPLRHLHLGGGTDHSVRQLSAIPVLAQAVSLEIDLPSTTGALSGTCGIEGVEALASSDHLTNLRQLSLHSHHIGEPEAARIAQSPTFANLTHLTLSGPSFDQSSDAFVARIIRSPHLRNLQQLQLGSDSYGPSVLRQTRRKSPPPNVSP
jgi:uncharacterized protein (TIGR02996 family)